MRRIRLLFLIVAAALIAGGLFLAYPRSTSTGPRFSPTDGAEARYRVSLAAHSSFADELVAGGTLTGPHEIELHLAGDLHLRFFRDMNAWRVAARLETTEQSLNGIPYLPPHALGEVFSFSMDALGYLGEPDFLPGIPEEVRGALTALLRYHQAVLPREERDAYTVRERDATGLCRTDYRLRKTAEELILSKNKRAYLSLDAAQQGAFAEGTTALPTRSSGTVRILSGAAWFTAQEYEETIELRRKSAVVATIKTRFSAAREDRVVSGLPESLASLVALLASDRYTSLPADDAIGPADTRWDPLSPAALADAFFVLWRTAPREAERLLIDLLRRDQARAASLIALLDNWYRGTLIMSVTDDESLVLWRLIVTAGSPAAQRALVDAITDRERTDRSRIRAITHLHELIAADPDTVRRLIEFRDDPASNADLRRLTLFALGGMSHGEDIPRESRSRIAAYLKEELRNSTGDRSRREQALAAIGNSGDPALAEEVIPLLTDPDPGVRAEAYRALRRMPEGAALIIAHYPAEAVDTVRAVAVRAMGELSLTAEQAAWVRDQLGQATGEASMLALIDLLGSELSADNEAALRTLLERGPAASIRKRIYRYIEPR